MTKTPLNELLTGSNLVALDKLACLLARLPDDYEGFNMQDFARTRDENNGLDPEDMDATLCGTVCCAAGHLPYLGYTHTEHMDYTSNWNGYCQAVTGLSDVGYVDEPTGILWRWCFSCSWGRPEFAAFPLGTPRHAAMRIAFILDHYDTYEGPLGDLRHRADDARVALAAMDAIGEEALLGQRRKVKLELFNPDLIEAIKA